MREFEQKLEEISYAIVNYIENESNIGILSGKEGLIIFLCYYSRYKNNQKFNEIAIENLGAVFNKINSLQISLPMFSAGLAGTGWLVQHLSKEQFIDTDLNEVLSDFDKHLYNSMIEFLESGKYDFLHAGLGIAFYLIERNTEECKQMVGDAIRLLDESKHIDKTGSYKWESVMYGKEDLKPIKKVYDISLSHGISSIISILSLALQKNIEAKVARDLLKRAINYVLQQEGDFDKNGSCFPATSIESTEGDFYRSRLGWCYGDLGVSLALYNASKILNDKNIEEKALEVLMKNTQRKDLDVNFIKDAGLCHGAAGVGHIYNQMYKKTLIPEFKKTADFWFRKTLEFAKWENSPAGFRKWTFKDDKDTFIDSFGFLEGIAGIGLAIISYVSEVESAWDRALLMS